MFAMGDLLFICIYLVLFCLSVFQIIRCGKGSPLQALRTLFLLLFFLLLSDFPFRKDL